MKPEASRRFASVMRHYAASAKGYHKRSAGFPWSLVKDREARTVLRALGSVQGEVVLDLGCGIGYYTTALLKAGAREVVAVDACQEMLCQVPTTRVRAMHANAAEFRLPEPVPAAVCAGMLEFVDEPRAVLERARDAVSPGGRMSILVPGDRLGARLYRRYHRRHGIEVWLFSPASLRATLQAAGWSVVLVEEVAPLAIVARARKGPVAY